jgi:hypothetical protein
MTATSGFVSDPCAFLSAEEEFGRHRLIPVSHHTARTFPSCQLVD